MKHLLAAIILTLSFNAQAKHCELIYVDGEWVMTECPQYPQNPFS